MERVIKEIGRAFFKALGYYPTTINGLKFKCDPYHLGFWHMAHSGHWEASTYNILNKFLRDDSIYVDIGSWVGPTVIYAAKKSRRVVCFEPDYLAYRYLIWNIELNKLRNVTPFNLAIGGHYGIRKMRSLVGAVNLGGGTSSLLGESKPGDHIDVVSIRWSDCLKLVGDKRVDFIKIDIEGGEFELIPTMKEYFVQRKPIVYLSFHAPYLEEGKRIQGVEQIIDAMGTYRQCFNEKLEPVTIEKLAENELLEQYKALLFVG